MKLAPRRQRVVGAEPRTLHIDGTCLVFGLVWLPLMGARPQQEARQLARQQKASHRVLLGQPAVAVGLLSWRAGSVQPLHAAAHCLASRYPSGSVAVCWPLPDGSHWVVGIHEGMVASRSDRCYASEEDAQSMLKELGQAYPRLSVLAPPVPAGDAWSMLAAEATAASHLQRIINGRRRRWLVLTGIALLVLAWFSRQSEAPSSKVPISVALQSSRAAPAEPPVGATSAGQVLDSHRLPGADGLRAALHSLQGLPLRPGGWRLERANCAWQAQGWSCQAMYRRHTAAADNLGLQSALTLAAQPHELVFDSLETAVLRWTRVWKGRDLTQASLSTTTENDRRLGSALQALQPVFRRLLLGGAGPALPPAESAALASLGVTRRAWMAEGPLRAVHPFLPQAEALAVHRIDLAVSPAGVVPTVRSSVFNLTMQGVLYERLAAKPH